MIFVGIIGTIAIGLLFGWIIPLILSAVARRRGWPGAGTWRIAGLVWAGLALLMALGVGAAIYFAGRVERYYSPGEASDAPIFTPADYPGGTATLRLASAGKLECNVEDATGSCYRCVASNGAVAVPAGMLTIRSVRTTAPDARGLPWTASFRLYGHDDRVYLDAGAATNAGLGPPFLLAARIEYSPVTRDIRLSPLCADRDGNNYEISRGAGAAIPTFQFLDADGQTVWSGKFVAG